MSAWKLEMFDRLWPGSKLPSQMWKARIHRLDQIRRPRSISTKTSLWNPGSKRSAGLYLSLSMLCLLSWWLFSMFWSSYVQSLKSWWNQLQFDFYSSLKMKSSLSLQFDNKCSNLTLRILTNWGWRTFWLAFERVLVLVCSREWKCDQVKLSSSTWNTWSWTNIPCLSSDAERDLVS